MNKRRGYFKRDETKMIENDARKVVKGFVWLLFSVILYVLTGWKIWLIVSAFPIALIIQVILGLFLLSKLKQKEKQENDELDF